MMDALRTELFDLPDLAQFVRVLVRLSAAVVLGGLLGYEREREGKAAGFRTHMLVALGAAVFTVAPIEAGMITGDLSRVFQGIVTGIGFIGAGTILKRADEQEIQGLTTAANLWSTAAVGMAVGLGHLWLPALGVGFALLILSVLGAAERGIRRGR
jgi:putative Mg2+ transporter-C (MgtC) family protein